VSTLGPTDQSLPAYNILNTFRPPPTPAPQPNQINTRYLQDLLPNQQQVLTVPPTKSTPGIYRTFYQINIRYIQDLLPNQHQVHTGPLTKSTPGT
jgi:hypothetical protein